MHKTLFGAAFLAASAFALAPVAASAQVIEVGPGGVGVHDGHHGPVEHRVVEDTHGDHGGHAEERREGSREGSHETSHGASEHH